ncbi:hypothetical protein H6P81_003451 [Aristolochia fimbriata]|uniref:Uncharacterized protein n=1 Tax=Aristolochia fimbriata TaxID=158543 RepID=A0AAV7FGX1_ARIFI|nr:hypothetical protein H6P81_003451 [Aristolochia fimbriata]
MVLLVYLAWTADPGSKRARRIWNGSNSWMVSSFMSCGMVEGGYNHEDGPCCSWMIIVARKNWLKCPNIVACIHCGD